MDLYELTLHQSVSPNLSVSAHLKTLNIGVD